MVGQNTDGAPAEHAQEAKDHFALLVVAVGETFVITVAVHGMTRVNGTGRTIAAEAGLSNLHNAGGTITTWPARQAQRPEAQRLRRKSRASGQAGTRSTNQAPRNNVIRTMTRYHGGARHVTRLVDAAGHKWGAYITAPAITRDWRLGEYKFKLQWTGRGAVPANDIRNIPVLRQDGSLIDYASNLVLDRWEDGTIPHSKGEHRDIAL